MELLFFTGKQFITFTFYAVSIIFFILFSKWLYLENQKTTSTLWLYKYYDCINVIHSRTYHLIESITKEIWSNVIKPFVLEGDSSLWNSKWINFLKQYLPSLPLGYIPQPLFLESHVSSLFTFLSIMPDYVHKKFFPYVQNFSVSPKFFVFSFLF